MQLQLMVKLMREPCMRQNPGLPLGPFCLALTPQNPSILISALQHQMANSILRYIRLASSTVLGALNVNDKLTSLTTVLLKRFAASLVGPCHLAAYARRPHDRSYHSFGQATGSKQVHICVFQWLWKHAVAVDAIQFMYQAGICDHVRG